MSQPRDNLPDRRALVGAVLAGAVILALARGLWPPGGMERPARRLIISNDDAGMCASVNAATVRALPRGIVSSTSVMVCSPGFREFAAFAAVHPEYDYGVHLTLTCDLPAQPWGPILPRAEVPSLCDEEGHLWRTTGQVGQHAQIAEVERELRAQIDRALEAGIRVSHIDHHMWVLFARPDLLDLYARLAIDYRLPARLCREPCPQSLRHDDPEWLRAYARCAERLQSAGFPLLDFIESDNYAEHPAAKRAFHLKTLRELPFGVSELVIHCADLGTPGPPPPDVERRAADTRFVLSEEVRRELERLDIQLVDWTTFARAARQPR